jgi:hypothetical protein
MSAIPARSYTRLAIAIVCGAVVISAAVFASSYLDRTTTVTQTATEIECGSVGLLPEIPANSTMPLVIGNDVYQCERVLVIPPGSTGVLVVSYQTDPSAVSPRSEGGTSIANLTASVLVPAASSILTVPEQNPSYVNATGVTITADPGSVNVTETGAANITVTYTIMVSSGTRGIFELNYLDACPTMIPLAVGYSASQINDSSFADYQPFLQGCTGLFMLSGGTLVSISGIQTAWLVQSVEQQNGTIG